MFKIFDKVGAFFDNLKENLVAFFRKLFAFRVEKWDLVQLILLGVSMIVVLLAPQYGAVGYVAVGLCMLITALAESKTSRLEWLIYILVTVPAAMEKAKFGDADAALFIVLLLGVVYQLFLAQFAEPNDTVVDTAVSQYHGDTQPQTSYAGGQTVTQQPRPPQQPAQPFQRPQQQQPRPQQNDTRVPQRHGDTVTQRPQQQQMSPRQDNTLQTNQGSMRVVSRENPPEDQGNAS